MTSRREDDWTPTSEMLAAYADGEFEGRDDLASLRVRVEGWLDRHSCAREELAEYRRLRKLWQASAPAEPLSEKWERMLVNLQRLCEQPKPQPATRRRVAWATPTLLAAACLALVVAFDGIRPTTSSNGFTTFRLTSDQGPFPVAGDRDVTILRVNGEDARSVVVGVLPLQGSLDVASKGDITLTSMKPHGSGRTMPHVHQRGPDAPMMIWARSDSDPDK